MPKGVPVELTLNHGNPIVPDDLRESLFSRWVLENPWPFSIAILLLAATIAWIAIQRDDRRPLLAAGVLAGLALLGLGLGLVVETPAEAASSATRRFVADAEAGRLDRLFSRLDPEATLHPGRLGNPGFPIEDLRSMLEALGGIHRIERNSITLLDAVGTGGDAAIVELACLTRTRSSLGYVPSRWIFEWERRDDRWMIRSITAASISGRVPNGRDVLRVGG